MSLKSELAPKGMSFSPTFFRLGDKYCTILSIISYPKFVERGYLANLTNIPGVKMVIKHIPIDFALMRKR